MKNLKKGFLLIAPLLLVAALTGCDNKGGSISPSINNGSSTPDVNVNSSDTIIENSSEEKKNVPTYKGMYIEQDKKETPSLKKGHYIPEIDDDDFDDDELDDDIEDLVDIKIITDDEVKYYVEPNQEFTLVVKLDNPMDYEIQSFTLNGKKYANYMFEHGSDMENIYLKVQAPSKPGYYDYTIDAIKYIDGDDIEDVDLSEGDQSIKAGIRFDQEPIAKVYSSKIESNRAIFDIELTDYNDLLKDKDVKIYLSDGTKIISQKYLRVGSNHVYFDNLKEGKKYQYAVMTTYDLCDGLDEKVRTLLKDEFTTVGMYKIGKAMIGKTSISFTLDKDSTVSTIKGISLHDKDDNYKLVANLENFEKLEFNNLLSNHNYTIKVEYSYMVEGKQVVDSLIYDFTTLSNKVPEVILHDLTSTKTSISYDFTIIDLDGVSQIEKVELYKQDLLVSTNEGDTLNSFENLESNTEYTIKFIYSYDLNDGNGKTNKFVTKTISTKAKDIPTVSIKNLTSDKTSISFDYEVTDLENVCSIDSVVLYMGEEKVQTITDLTTKVFENLLSNTEYIIKVNYSYDLNDGKGVIKSSIEDTISTKAKSAPSVVFDKLESTKTSIEFNYQVTDDDKVCRIDKVELYHGEELVNTLTDLSKLTFEDLLSNSTYELKLYYSYDLNDGATRCTNSISKEVKTSSKEEAKVEFGILVSDQTSIHFDYTIVDKDNVCSIEKVELYKGKEKVQTITDLTTKVFENLLSNTTYELRLHYSFDLNDGKDSIKKFISQEINTENKSIPSVIFNNVTSDQTHIYFDYEIIDKDNICIIESIELYKGSKKVQTIIDPSIKSFEGLLSNTDYLLKINYSYDLNDGSSRVISGQETTIKTYAKSAPTISFDRMETTKNEIFFSYKVLDEDQILTIDKIELYKGDQLVDTLKDYSTLKFEGLLSNTLYEVKIYYSYDLNGGFGKFSQVLSQRTCTKAKKAPTVDFTELRSDTSNVYFDYKITDIDNVCTIDSVDLYIGDERVQSITDPTIKVFKNLLSDTSFFIRIHYLYDLQDGKGIIRSFANRIISTKELKIPEVNIQEPIVTYNSIVSDLKIIDESNSVKIIKSELYKGEVLVQENKNLDIKFNNLENFTDYLIKVTYTYDLNDGLGIVEKVVTKQVKTAPTLEVTNTRVINTSAVNEGEIIYLAVTINNPNGAIPVTATVNGIEQKCDESSTPNNMFINIVNNGEFLGGMTTFVIEEITFKVGKQLFSVPCTDFNSCEVFINGKIEIEGLEFINDNNEPIDYVLRSNTVNIGLYLKNKTGYQITDTNLGKFERVTDDFYILRNYRLNKFLNNIEINLISYQNSDINKTLHESKRASVYMVNNVGYISTYTDFNNLQDYTYYELTNDIDFRGKEWLGHNFTGVINGKNHKIYNLSLVRNFKDINQNVGLFATFSGVAENLRFSNCSLISDLDAPTDEFRAGLLAGYVLTGSIRNIDIDETCIVRTSGFKAVGSLVGEIYSTSKYDLSKVINVNSRAFVSSSRSYTGLIGEANCWYYDTYIIIKNCTNSGTIKGDSYVGGVVGYLYILHDTTSMITMDNCVNTGKIIKGNYTSTALYGHVNNPLKLEMKNCA